MKISIVIPTRERALYLRQSLATALAIDDPDVEIIVTDNESTDDTAAHAASPVSASPPPPSSPPTAIRA